MTSVIKIHLKSDISVKIYYAYMNAKNNKNLQVACKWLSLILLICCN
ncbi:hypothetical protein VIBNISFn27_940098 [Vibrio nigripulchritudo SFn27]|uniref:Uncharacterized protein n=1 Tax=Vibrio nigripulchritudo TaxID=28173 RepID=U4KBS1_9VIBR|nr:hypothetical protein VIBNIBLFn1_470098 [Vibrio nigripulchritudo BLFn1]CCN91431.1 hypothetical protein VIBNISFn27_940098 [Vibrio nigripulchritudo SFn27]CCN97595.1 hypothetical protein VIBNIENn2_990097 [Vibrio nigripulchritudo ENn2]CCO38738.1 hypothetical protein VIBNISFn135_1060098 [Vibrio nigripulchritudo SFn135]CCO55143.1 hypothetical protein VIBNIWn13_780099 [Vibrio nigripulchritudo Wn13]CCO60252.1 hypothetical protein VIBNI_B0438 [Vibrio nigripulchritudo]